MKKFLSFVLVLAVFLSFGTVAFAADNPSGATVDEVAEGEAIDTNNGTVTTNKGTVTTNNTNATVGTNNGTVGTNNGRVITNDAGATVRTNNDEVHTNKGTVTTNNGEVEYSNGEVTTNNDTVVTNEGTVTTNNGTVIINEADATVTTNNGTVELNKGTVITNDAGATVRTNNDEVKTNKGTVEYNTNKGTVTTNEAGATVITNDAGATVTENNGTVGTNNGTVTINKANGVVEKNNGTVGINYGTVNGGTIRADGSIGKGTDTIFAVAYAKEGTEAVCGTNVVKGASCTLMNEAEATAANITKTGYKLTGWSDSDGQYSFGESITVTKARIFSAIWEKLAEEPSKETHEESRPTYNYKYITGDANGKTEGKSFFFAKEASRLVFVKLNGKQLEKDVDFTVTEVDGGIQVDFTGEFFEKNIEGTLNISVMFADNVIYKLIAVNE